MGSGTVTSAENRAVIDQSTGVIERTNAAPSRAADWATMASPMGPIVVDSGTPPSLGGLPEPQVRKNLFAAASWSAWFAWVPLRCCWWSYRRMLLV